MKKTANIPVLFLWALLLLVLPCSTDASQKNVTGSTLKADQSIHWLNYTEAMSEGRFNDKKIMLFFTMDNHTWCDKMQKETFSDPRVIDYLNKHFSVSKVDRERFPTLAKKYKVDAMPTLWFLDSKGKGLTTTDGFMPPRQMLLILEFIQTELYRETTFKQWKENRSRR